MNKNVPIDPASRASLAKWFFLAAFVLVLYAAVRLLAPLSGALLAAAILAIMIHPLHARLQARLRRPTTAAALTTGALVLLVVLPLVLAGWMLSREATRFYPEARDWFKRVETISPDPGSAGPWVRLWAGGRGFLEARQFSVKEKVLEHLDEIGMQTSDALGALLKNTALLLLNIVLVVVSLFFFLRDGPFILASGLELVPMAATRKHALLERVKEVLDAVVYGLFAAALVQGLLSWAGFALFGIAFPALLGTLCLLTSPIPFLGPALIWVPIAVATAVSGSATKALALALWFGLLVGLSDNLVRPLVIGTKARLPIPLIFLGAVGGIRAFGWSGIFIGPILITLVIAFARIFREEYHGP
ncbi:MAG: AI-2E family transporter [Elusimicrobiota bacterium]